MNFLYSEAATWGILWEKVFLKMSQNSQENTCAGFPFLIKLQAWGPLWRFTVNFAKLFGTPFFADRSNHWRCSIKKVFLRIWQNSQLCQSLFFSNFGCLKPATLLRKTLAQVFSSKQMSARISHWAWKAFKNELVRIRGSSRWDDFYPTFI